MNKLSNDTLTKLFAELNASIEKLKTLSKISKENFLKNYEKIDTAKYNFIIAIEVMVDICSHIIAENNLGAPEEYSEVFKIMGSKGIFPEVYVKNLVEMTKFRNLLVHVYWKVHDDKIYQYLKNNLEDFEIFKKHVNAYLSDQ